MNTLTDKVSKLYLRYFLASFGSALLASFYSLVDSAVVGQYQGADGVAALAVIMPIWNMLFSPGLLFGIGGAVFYGAAKGRGDKKEANEIFTVSVILGGIASLISWFVIFMFDEQLLRLFGADNEILVLALKYLNSIRFVVPVFVFENLFAAFLRNDNSPILATCSIIGGGLFNIFGDVFFAFGLNMGIFGCGLATAIGNSASVAVLCLHFFSKKNTLRLVFPTAFLKKTSKIIAAGFSSFFVDIAVGIVSIMMNNQIMAYKGNAALAVYGVVLNVTMVAQSCAYGVGQAAQPLISINYGAKEFSRVKRIHHLSLIMILIITVVISFICLAIPLNVLAIFIKPTEQITSIAPYIMRMQFLSFLLLPLNIYSTYYFVSILKPRISFIVSLMRGLLLSGILIYVLPLLFGADSLWLAMPVGEFLTSLISIPMMIYCDSHLGDCRLNAKKIVTKKLK